MYFELLSKFLFDVASLDEDCDMCGIISAWSAVYTPAEMFVTGDGGDRLTTDCAACGSPSETVLEINIGFCNPFWVESDLSPFDGLMEIRDIVDRAVLAEPDAIAHVLFGEVASGDLDACGKWIGKIKSSKFVQIQKAILKEISEQFPPESKQVEIAIDLINKI